MWKEQEKKRLLKSLICVVLAVLLFVMDVPDLGLVLKVMANPNPDQLMTLKETEETEIRQKDTETESGESSIITERDSGSDLTVETESESESGQFESPETNVVEEDTELFQTEGQKKDNGDNWQSDYANKTIPEDIVYDEIIEGDTVLSGGEYYKKKILYKGNVYIDNRVNFSYSTIRVTGNIVFQSGALESNESTIYVDGDFRIQSEDERGEYGSTQAHLHANSGTHIVVGGDFYTQSTNHSNEIDRYRSVLELHGNFNQVDESYFKNYGKLVFAGEKDQHISMPLLNYPLEMSLLGRIEVSNQEGKIYADTILWNIELTQDTVIGGEEVSLTGNTNGYNLKIDHNYLENGLILNKGSVLHIGGDYRLQKKSVDGGYEETGCVLGAEEGARIIVKGDFYTQSASKYNSLKPGAILELYGDFYQLGPTVLYGIYGINDVAHFGTVIFAGNETQQITMESNQANLLNIIQNESCPSLALNCTGGMVEFASDVKIENDAKIYEIGIGHVLDLQGDASIAGKLHLGGAFKCSGNLSLSGPSSISGVLKIDGDLFIEGNGYLWMYEDNAVTAVKGSLYNNALKDQRIDHGLLDIKGDFIQSTESTFSSLANAFIQIRGAYHHNVNFPVKAKVFFGNFGIDPSRNYTFTKQPIWGNLYLAVETDQMTERIAARYFGKPGTNAATGNYAQSFSDITVQSAIGPFEITHSYNSMSEEDGVLGKGFWFSQNIKMKTETVLDSEQKIIFLPDGSRYTFLKNSNDQYDALDSRARLIEIYGDFQLRTPDQAKFAFDKNGHIQYMEDKIGNRITYSVDDNGNVVLMQDSSGTNVSFHYDGKLLKSIKNEETGELASFEFTEGKLSKSTDANGKATGYEYNSNGLLTKIINNNGSIFEEITYINGGIHDKKVATVKNMIGNIDTYLYDDILRKTTITDSNGRSVTKKFDFHYNLTDSTNALGENVHTQYTQTNGIYSYCEVESETDAYGNVTFYERDSKGRVIKVTYPDRSTEITQYDYRGNISKSIDKNGTATYYIYDDSGLYLLEKATPLDGSSIYNDGADKENFAITTYTYDMDQAIKGLLLTERNPLGDDKNYIEYIRNQKGQTTAMITYMDGKPYKTIYQYNEKWLPTMETAPDGIVTKYDYNKHNEITRKTTKSEDGKQKTQERYSYDNMGNKVIEAGPLSYDSSLDDLESDIYTGPGTHFTYNEAGQKTVKTDALGNTTVYEYDLYGNVLKETDSDGSYAEYTYDALDRKTSTMFYDSTTSERILLEEQSYSQSGKNLQTTKTAYLDQERTAVTTEITDFAGRIISAVDADGNTISKTYTGDGKVLSETDPYGKTATYTYDALGNLTSLISPFDGDSYSQTVYSYDKAGNMLTELVSNQAVGSSSVTCRKTAYEYDAWNNLLKTIQYDGDNPAGYVQGYYDFKGRLLREYKGLSKPLTITGLDQIKTNGDDVYTVTKYEYNYQDKVSKMTDSAGQMETNTYDSAGNLLQTKEQGGGTYQAAYDILGRKTEESKSFSGKTAIRKTFAYDSMGRLVSTTENSDQVNFTYNGLGQMIQEEYASTGKEYQYDHSGAVLSVRISDSTGELRNTKNTYDILGRLTSVSENGKCKASYTYDKKSRLLTTKYENGITESTDYNDGNMPISVVNKDASGKIISEYQYTYAVDGNQLSKTDAGGTTSYQYDGLNRLIEEMLTNTGEVETTSYEYDENGNRIRMEKKTGTGLKWETYTYDQLDRLLTKSTPDGETAYTYDRNGNQLTKSEDKKEEIQTYDALNRLISWTDGSHSAEYTYYPDNNRASKTVNGVTTNHIWSNGEIQVDITEGKTVNYIHGHRLIESDYGTYLYNAHGDVVQLVKNDLVSQRYDYDAYGNPKGEENREDKTAEKQEARQNGSSHVDQNPYRYAGEYRDKETGYIYLRARYYEVKLGRFLNVDPAKHGTNWYAYAGGNPVLYHDPSGLSFSEFWDDVKNTGKKFVSGAKSFFNSIGSAASSAGKKVKEFASTPGGKIAVGVSVIAIAGIATLATGGAAAGLAGGIAQGALIGSSAVGAIGAGSGAYSAVVANRESTGSWDGSFSAALDGAASGFQSGALTGGFLGMPVGAASYGASYLMGRMINPNSLVNEGITGAEKWVDDAGNIQWPPNRGFDGEPVKKILDIGTRIDRYGFEGGTFVSPEGLSYASRSLAPGTNLKPYNIYEIIKPIEVQAGKIAPWFGEPGGGIQYEFNQSISQLLENGIIRRVGP